MKIYHLCKRSEYSSTLIVDIGGPISTASSAGANVAISRTRKAIHIPFNERDYHNNRRAGRPFIEHQVEIVNFEIALRGTVAAWPNLCLLIGDEIIVADRQRRKRGGNPFALRAKLSYAGWIREANVIPDFVFSLTLARGRRFKFMIEIDRGKMPIRRSDPDKTSFEQKMPVYLSGHGARQHKRQLGWKNFRMLSLTTDRKRVQHMQETLRDISGARGGSLFLFSTYEAPRTHDLLNTWTDGAGRAVQLVFRL